MENKEKLNVPYLKELDMVDCDGNIFVTDIVNGIKMVTVYEPDQSASFKLSKEDAAYLIKSLSGYLEDV